MACSKGPWNEVCAYGFRKLDPHVALKITPTSLERYREATKQIVEYCHKAVVYPSCCAEFDMLLIEWKNDPDEQVTKSRFQYAVAAIEFFNPHNCDSFFFSQFAVAVFGGQPD